MTAAAHAQRAGTGPWRSRQSAPTSPRAGGPRRRLVEPGRGAGRSARTWPAMNSARSSCGARVFGSTPDGGRGAPTGRGVEPGPGRGGIRRAAGPARRTLAPLRPRRISGRAAALGVLLFALMLAYAYPLRVYLAQQAQIDQMQADQADAARAHPGAGRPVARWEDEEYVDRPGPQPAAVGARGGAALRVSGLRRCRPGRRTTASTRPGSAGSGRTCRRADEPDRTVSAYAA